VADTEGDVAQFVVACPMCTTMFEDGRKTGGFEDDLEIVDLTELLVEAMAAGAAAVDDANGRTDAKAD
jgi:Fe-S oxidoreductase